MKNIRSTAQALEIAWSYGYDMTSALDEETSNIASD